MKSGQTKRILNRTQGSSQSDRTNTILHQDYVKIDERGLAEYLSFLYKYSESITFYNLKNKPAGNWQQFTGSDLSVLLSRIAIIDPQKLDFKFKDLLFEFENEIDESKLGILFHQLYQEVFNLILFFDEWYSIAFEYDSSGKENELGTMVQNAIEYRLSKKYKRLVGLKAAYNQLGLGPELISSGKLDKIWDIDESPEETYELVGETSREKISHTVKQLTFLFKDFIRGITSIVNAAPQLLLKSLHSGIHAPQNALLITFIKLFEHVKGDLNQITRKHLDYYYYHKLQQQFQDAIPDKVHLHFLLADHVSQHIIEKDTLFVAGADEDGYEYLYSADHDLVLNKASVTAIKVLYLSKNPLIAEGKKYQLTSNIYHKEIDLTSGNPQNDPSSFPSFGEEQYVLGDGKRSMESSEIGFAISSPVLLLREGNRKVRMDLKFNLKSMSSLVSFLEDFSVEEHLSADGAFHKLFSISFNIHLSSSEGWFKIDNYKIAPKKSWTDGIMSIFFELDLAAPAIVPLNEEHIKFGSRWPFMKITLSTDRAMYAYSYLRDLIIEECTINVDVDQIKGLQVYNNLGKIDVSSPFYPFGTTPNQGAYLLIGYDELFKKEINDITLDLEWQNLPRNENGFKEYYRKYDKNIDNESFKVSLRALSGHQFSPRSEDKLQIFSLFSTKKTKNGEVSLNLLDRYSRLNEFDIDALQIKSDYKMDNLPDYDNTTRSGYLKLELVAPGIGFGHEMYPPLFANEVIEKAKSSSKNGLDLPNPPFAPQLSNLQLGYKASSKILFDKSATRRSNPEADERFYHLHPFGIKTTFKNSIPYDHYLLPQFESNGYLFIGLSELKPPTTLTLYFELEQRMGNNFDVEIPTVEWQYLSNNQWMDFNKSEVIFDSTNNFTVSGIVKLSVPDSITIGNSILAEDKYWLSAKVEGDVSLLSRTKSVHTQVLTASWVSHRPGSQWRQPILPGTIQRFVHPRSEIAGVFQPAPSFSGITQENSQTFYARVSERLRHKHRAVTPWDYEHLIMEEFPFIDRVKCITPMDEGVKLNGGEFIVVIVPAIERMRDFYLPKINFNTLNDIQKYVTSISSPFVNIRVVNPVYEQVKVNCKVKFIDNNKKGEYIQQLHEDLRKLICPWFYSSSARMNFGGYIKHEEILTFLESLEYITFITKLSVVIIHYNNAEYSLSDSMDEGKILQASAVWSILVPMEEHAIDIIEKTIHETPERAAIERMRLGADFVVAGESDMELEDFPPYKKGEDKDYFVVEIDI